MSAHAQTLGHARPTAATVLARVVCGNRDHPTPGACCLGVEDGPELCPARVGDGLGQMAVPH